MFVGFLFSGLIYLSFIISRCQAIKSMMNNYILLMFLVYSMALTFLPRINSCPFHERLRELRRQQRERLQGFRENLNNRPSTHLLGQPIRAQTQLTDHSNMNHRQPSRSHTNPRPGVTRYTGFNSRTGYFGSNRNDNPQRQVYIGNVNTVYRPEDYVSCPNSRYHVCPIGSVCVFEYGQYRCRQSQARTCREGLKRVNISDIQFQCIDINECDDPEMNNCEQICRNLIGTFRCDCNPGFSIQDDGTCTDTDECAGIHRCQHECVNTIGSYDCSCPDGYTLLPNRRCKDIDECLDENICLEDETCLNTHGGHECNVPEPCGEGYHRPNTTASIGPCVIVDFSSQSDRPVTISHNRFALTSNYPAYGKVGKLHFTRQYGHTYTFKILRGGSYFRIEQSRYSSYISIRTRQILRGPQVYEMRILVTDTDNRPGFRYNNTPRKTTSRVDLSFVVSAYTF